MKTDGVYRPSDTIAAEATPPGRGGISVIRVSGSIARGSVGSLLDRELPEAGCVKFGTLNRTTRTGNKELIDEVVLTYFCKPNSYTGEDVIEISTHGSPIIVAEVLEELYKQNVRPARPGEFTLRAFLNDKIDLTQAEAVADIISAGSREAAEQAKRQLKRGIGRATNALAERVRDLLVQCELELDFVEDDVELVSREERREIVQGALDDVGTMLRGYKRSRSLREGVKVVILGPPNAGKSSIFNALIGEARAIVNPKPGTTRDVIRAETYIDGVCFEFFDTAGLRQTSDDVEDEGMRRALTAAKESEFRIEVYSPDTQMPDGESCKDIVIVVNKADMGVSNFANRYLLTSALNGSGIVQLKEEIYKRAVGNDLPGEGTINRERHYLLLLKVKEALHRTLIGTKEDYPAEMIAEELREALGGLDEITGKKGLNDLLDAIFSGFCIGK